MGETKKCVYCHQVMSYQSRKQILSKSVVAYGVSITKYVEFMHCCWCCDMREDDCDVVDDHDANQINLDKARRELNHQIHEVIAHLRQFREDIDQLQISSTR